RGVRAPRLPRERKRRARLDPERPEDRTWRSGDDPSLRSGKWTRSRPPVIASPDRSSSEATSMIEARTIATRTHGRYLVDARDATSGTLIGFHGYQEPAEAN